VCRRVCDDYAAVAGNYVECTSLHRKFEGQGAGYVDGGAASWGRLCVVAVSGIDSKWRVTAREVEVPYVSASGEKTWVRSYFCKSTDGGYNRALCG
jgi:hypothetical protein